MSKHPCDALQGFEVGVELALQVATHPGLIAADVGGEGGLRDAGRSDPGLDLLTCTVVEGLRHWRQNRLFEATR